MARKGSKGAGLAQSGGKATTFGGGKGGTPLSRNVTKAASRGSGKQGGFNNYTIRNSGGDSTIVPSGDRRNAAPPPPVHPGGKGATAIVRPKILPPVLRGSTNALKGKYK